MSKLAHSNQAAMDEIEARAALGDGRDIEAEANEFAMALLMPEGMLRADLAKLGRIDIEDEGAIHKLAKRYRVSNNVMVLRLAQLAARR